MSGTGNYEIQSLVREKPFVGIYPPLPPKDGTGPVIISENVHINGKAVWHLTQQGDTDIYQFSIVDSFEYTGLSDKKAPEGSVVIATNTADENRLWSVKKIGYEEYYIIALADDTTLGWTVSGVDPKANIVVDPLPPPNVQNETLPNPFYHLFKLTKLYE